MQKRSRHERITRINSKVGRDINRSIILNTVRRNQPISRAEISELTRLNKSTVSSIVASLLDEDLLLESPDRRGGVGRVPVNLTVKQGRHFVGAISLDAPCCRVAVVDIDGTVRSSEVVRPQNLSPSSLVAEVMMALQAQRSRLGEEKFHGVGVTVGGIVDSNLSHVVYASNLGWSHVDLGSLIRQHLADGETVFVENDAKASALAELLLGKHPLTSTNLVFLSVGAGIGAGVAVHGRILGGSAHAAGEVGHMTVAAGGDLCSCGNTGCWELVASERAPVAQFIKAKYGSHSNGGEVSILDVLAAARNGDTDGLAAVHAWARNIGVGIGNIISMFDPEVVVIGGSISSVWKLVEEDVIHAAEGKGKFSRQRTATILPTSLPDTPSLLGGAALCIRRVFHDFSLTA